ncbi:MAG: quinol:cytochrome C oxidoreductase [Bacteroidota bacterium]|nr:quinol:cytochrome C oxidoreductase [Bacteroidota bacterium]
MYTFSGKLKTFSIVLMIIGILGIGYSFFSSSQITLEDVEKMEQVHHTDKNTHDTTELSSEDHQKHLEHVLHQLHNKPWSALYVACIFFFLISVGVLAFYAIQIASQAGWSPVLFRVMEGITAYVLPGAIIFFIVLLCSGFHLNHLFVWMADGITDPNHANYDFIVAGKSAYLNVPFFLIRAFLFLLIWVIYRNVARRLSLRQDAEPQNAELLHKKMVKAAALFLVLFIITESIAAWDWIMSFDPHWYSTLFAWYVFASFFVSGITTIALVTIYLQSKGLLTFINKSHLHDLAKFMFAISIFWTYLWFSQFMLIWYSNIPEEVTYFIQRIDEFTVPFFGMLFLNLVFPLLVLMDASFKRVKWIVVMVGIVILIGHYIDFFNMIMPATVGASWSIGIPEISSVMFFLGLFIFVVFNALSKHELLAKNNPLIEESKHFHY